MEFVLAQEKGCIHTHQIIQMRFCISHIFFIRFNVICKTKQHSAVRNRHIGTPFITLCPVNEIFIFFTFFQAFLYGCKKDRFNILSQIYKDADSAYADTCLEAAKKAWSYLETHKEEKGFKNPEEIVTGEYPDIKDEDEYFWAAAELYKATEDAAYKEAMAELVGDKKNLQGFG